MVSEESELAATKTRVVYSDDATAIQETKIKGSAGLLRRVIVANPTLNGNVYLDDGTVTRVTATVAASLGLVRASNIVTATVTASTFQSGDVDKKISISGATDGTYDGIFTIVGYTSGTVITYNHTGTAGNTANGALVLERGEGTPICTLRTSLPAGSYDIGIPFDTDLRVTVNDPEDEVVVVTK